VLAIWYYSFIYYSFIIKHLEGDLSTGSIILDGTQSLHLLDTFAAHSHDANDQPSRHPERAMYPFKPGHIFVRNCW